MIFLHNRLASSFCLGMMLLSVSFVYSCKTAAPPDPKEEFVRSLKGANVDGYFFSVKEEENRVTTSLTNGSLREPIKLDSSNTLVLGYAGVKDKKTNTTKTYKAEIVKADKTVTLQLTDINSGEVTKDAFPPPKPRNPTEPTFNTLQECIDDFNCKERPALQCEANRTCRNQFADIDCCLKDGTCFSILIIVRPTSFRCLVVFPFDLDTLMLRQ